MTAYKLKPGLPALPQSIQEIKDKRRKVLEGVWERRKIIYQR